LAKTVLRLIPRSVQPNHLTIARFWLIPFVAYFLFFGNYRIGLFVFILTALTDGIDGALARTRGQITEWGRLYDPVADKLLVATAVLMPMT
jgi:phosphatidylglycerophosphate synthase